MKIRCTSCKDCCAIELGGEAPTVDALRQAAPHWALANIVTLKDGTVAVGQLACWCPCCKSSQNCNG